MSATYSPEVEGKRRQFHRVLMSYVDFQEAYDISSYVLEQNLHAAYPRENRLVLRAFNCAMIVAYCRPFSGNDPGAESKIPDLSGRFLRVLSEEELELHDTVMADRNTVLAHSDSQAWQMKPRLLQSHKKDTLFPIHHDVHAPLLREVTVTFNHMCLKMLDVLFEERKRLELELKDYHILEIDEEIKKLKPPKPVVLKRVKKAWKDLHLCLFGMYPKEGRILRFDALSRSDLEVLLEAFGEMLEREKTRSR